MNNPFA